MFVRYFFRKYILKDLKILSNEHITQRARLFWKKKLPMGEQYEYVICDPFEVLGFDTGYEKLYLVGDNWLSAPNKPIVVAIGFNDWKFGFVADYLPEYRVAFGSRKATGWNMIKILIGLKVKPDKVIIWGYTDKRWLRFYLKMRGITVWRCEDGFIRSSSLGASHSTPYSLVFDDVGLYYNSYRPSKIENLLNTHCFSEEFMREYSDILPIFNKLRISKYNPFSPYKDSTIKVKKRVLVIGQVDNDASIRYGNPDNWTSEQIIRLAKYENPDAEILYRPHPEVYEGYQKSKFRKDKVSSYSVILSPDEHILDLIDRIDHVYVITSLSGFEALLRGKRVTVLGRPFYAGWGLTDDRCKFRSDSRTRTLSLEELFVGAYILYPRFLLNSLHGQKLECFKNDIISTIQIINSERKSQIYKHVDLNPVPNLIPLHEISIGAKIRSPNNCNLADFKEIATYFKAYNIDCLLMNAFWGSLNDDKKPIFLQAMLSVLDKNIVLSFVRKLYEKKEIDIIYYKKLFVDALVDINADYFEIENFFEEYRETIYFENTTVDLKEGDSISEELLVNYASIGVLETAFEEKRMTLFFDQNKIDAGMNSLFFILRNTSNVTKKVELINLAAKMMYIKFQFQECTGAAKLSMILDIEKNNRKALGVYIDALFIQNKYQGGEIIDYILMSIKKNPELLSKYRAMVGRGTREFLTIESVLDLDSKDSINKMTGFIEKGDYQKSKTLFYRLLKKDGQNHSKLIKVFTDFLHADGKTKEALSVLENRFELNPSDFVIRQLIRLSIFIGNFEKAKYYYQYYMNTGAKVNSTIGMPILLGENKISQAYKCYLQEDFVIQLKYLIGEKFRVLKDGELNISSLKKSMVLASYGPGDEIRFISIYRDIKKLFGEIHFAITCDYRLYNLLTDSFDDIKFIPVKRTRAFRENYIFEDYKDLPSTNLSTLLDNNAYRQIKEYEAVFMVTDFIHLFRAKYEDFIGKSCLKADTDLIMHFQQRLHSLSLGKNKLIGINWRSSLTNFSRMEHYLTIQQLAPIFEIDGVSFVNLQYDDCVAEIDWINEHYPGKIINFEDLDQYNDFDGVSALISCLDLVIAPATTVAELAGALGVRAWLFSNSSEIDWRKKDDRATDVWYNSITIIDVPEKGNKELLVDRLYNELILFATSNI